MKKSKNFTINPSVLLSLGQLYVVWRGKFEALDLRFCDPRGALGSHGLPRFSPDYYMYVTLLRALPSCSLLGTSKVLIRINIRPIDQ